MLLFTRRTRAFWASHGLPGGVLWTQQDVGSVCPPTCARVHTHMCKRDWLLLQVVPGPGVIWGHLPRTPAPHAGVYFRSLCLTSGHQGLVTGSDGWIPCTWMGGALCDSLVPPSTRHLVLSSQSGEATVTLLICTAAVGLPSTCEH